MFGHKAKLFITTSYDKDFLTAIVFAKFASGEVIRLRSIYSKSYINMVGGGSKHSSNAAQTEAGSGRNGYLEKNEDWPIDPESVRGYCAPAKRIMNSYSYGFDGSGKNDFYLPCGYLHGFPPQYERIDVRLIDKEDKAISKMHGVRIYINCYNKSYAKPVQFPVPPGALPPKVFEKEVIRSHQETLGEFSSEEKIILEASKETKQLAGLRATARMDAPAYTWKIPMLAPIESHDIAIACWDKVLDGLMVND